MKRTNKKGFTIVELVIVVAVVAVLAAVLIPTFSEVVEEAQMAKDLALYRNIQTIIQAERMLGSDIANSEKAMEVLRKNGINDITTYSDTYSISWDDSCCNFVLIASDGSVVTEDGQDDVIEVQPEQPEGEEKQEEENESNPVNVVINLDREIFDFKKIQETASLKGTYTAKLVQKSVQKEYYITSFSITMGGKDVTPDDYNPNDENAEICILEVTGDIEISATTVVNQVRLSKDITGNAYYGYYGDLPQDTNNPQNSNRPGFINDYTLSTNVNTDSICASSATGYTSTGWIFLPWEETNQLTVFVYIKDGTILQFTNNKNKFYFYYNIEKSKYKDSINISAETEYLVGNEYMKFTLNANDYGAYNYLRLSVQGRGENLIVTFNEPILPNN